VLFDQCVLQVQQIVVGTDLLPEPARLSGVAGAVAVSAGRVAEAGHRLTHVVPRAQTDGEVMAAPELAVLAADQQVVFLASHVTEAERKAGDAADVLDGVEPCLLGFGLVAGR